MLFGLCIRNVWLCVLRIFFLVDKFILFILKLIYIVVFLMFFLEFLIEWGYELESDDGEEESRCFLDDGFGINGVVVWRCWGELYVY